MTVTDFPYTLSLENEPERRILNRDKIQRVEAGALFHDGEHDCIVMTGYALDNPARVTETFVLRAYELARFYGFALRAGFVLDSNDLGDLVAFNPNPLNLAGTAYYVKPE